MNGKYQMRFTGSGGQGVILASVILAEAAVIASEYALQSPSYGPEARGGMCKAEAILSQSDIHFSKVTAPNFLLALTQSALDAYAGSVASDCVVMVDESLCVPHSLTENRVIRVPILNTACERLGKPMTANIVAIGAINSALHLFSAEVITEAVKRHISVGTEEINLRALTLGEELVA